MKKLQVYLLAAGKGERAGGAKAWQDYKGKTLMAAQMDFLLTFFPAAKVTISVQQPWLTRCKAIQPLIRWVTEDPDSSPLAALQVLINQSPLKSWAFFYHVDQPVWEAGLFRALAKEIPAAQAEGFEAIAPLFNGKKGHPVLLSPALAAPILALNPASDRLDYFLRDRKEKNIEVPFSCIHENWNLPISS